MPTFKQTLQKARAGAEDISRKFQIARAERAKKEAERLEEKERLEEVRLFNIQQKLKREKGIESLRQKEEQAEKELMRIRAKRSIFTKAKKAAGEVGGEFAAIKKGVF